MTHNIMFVRSQLYNTTINGQSWNDVVTRSTINTSGPRKHLPPTTKQVSEKSSVSACFYSITNTLSVWRGRRASNASCLFEAFERCI